MKYTTLLVSTLVLFWAGAVSAASPWPGDSGTVIADASQLGSGYEPSDIVYHSRLNKLIVVNDDGEVTLMDTDGTNVTTWTLAGGPDVEGIAIADVNSNYVYLGIEHPDSIVEFDINTGTFTGKTWGLTETMTGNDGYGLEALTFVPNGSHLYPTSNSGGLFYAGLQETGKIYVFDVNLSQSGTVTHRGTISSNYTDVSGLHFEASTGVLYAIYDYANRLQERETDGTVIVTYELPGNDQEAITLITNCPSASGNATVYIGEDVGPEVWAYGSYEVDCIQTSTPPVDADDDGYTIDVDCDDTNRNVWTYITYYRDADGDTLGDVNTITSVCDNNVPEGYVTNANDTDDTVPSWDMVAPNVPTNLTAELIALRKARLSWAGEGEYYNLVLKRANGSTLATFTNITGPSKTIGRNYLRAGRTYSFSVQACNAYGCSEYSSDKSFGTYTIKQWRKVKRLR